ncbi:TPA: site-specific DNA-methyltransferase [Pseudomonas aeruginosa]|nr:site-specific DNA-methyltransferase [Pseudomonas aeruginosa]HBO0067084.1 site-specific DNA-methyltransferase [Pseudomonas aeruginosa]HEJ2884357.1 site-specific DNA-methyltransferase [Pseudomonas aeruginosa]
MQIIDAASHLAQSADLVSGNIEQLKALFPELITEGPNGVSVNVDVLKALVGDRSITDTDEKYGLNWHGKRRARQLALTPSTGTLRPCPEESVDWDSTQNLMIEGDNLEVLKLLQKSYAGKVKLIYIDPPYNTGKDFVYPDNFQDNIKNYLELTGQVEGGQKISSNTEASGRFHTDWLNMIYPRLKLARNLLRDDGALFISIDDGEIDNLKKACCEIFGEETFVGILSVLVNPRGRHLDKFIAQTHDNVAVFVKDPDVAGSIVGMAKEGAMLEEYDKEDERGKYRELGLRNRNQAFNPVTRPNLFFPLYVEPSTGRVSLGQDHRFTEKVLPVTADGVETCWTWGREKIEAENELLTASRMSDGTWRVFRKDYLNGENGETASTLAKSIWLDKEFNNDYGRKSIKELLGAPVMDFPKSPFLIQRIVSIASRSSDIVMDFFAGSGTTGHSVMAQNAIDGARRRYILVQLPEPLSAEVKEQKVAAEFCDALQKPRTIAEITKERLRRAGNKVKEDDPLFSGDTGFRVFKLATSNIQAWNPNPSDLEQTLFAHQDHLVEGRTESDILYELLLKLGLDLCVPIDKRSIQGKDVHSVGGGVLMACLAEHITRDDVEPLAQGIVAWHEELQPVGDATCVFRDSAFADDVAKTNLAAILEQHGIQNVRSL